jgi:hypothetical protein
MGASGDRAEGPTSKVDHIVYATPDLSRGVDEIENLTGVRASVGGTHPAWGTRNALIALAPASYLEIIAPDPEQPSPKKPRIFGLDDLDESRLAAWFVNARNLQSLRYDAVRNGVPLGEVKPGSRRRADGVQLSWQLTDPLSPVADGVVPFFIDWGDSPHPALTAARGASLIDLRAEHPDAENVQRMLTLLELDLPLKRGLRPQLIATLDCPRGRVELR